MKIMLAIVILAILTHTTIYYIWVSTKELIQALMHRKRISNGF